MKTRMNNNIRILKNKYAINGYRDSLFTRNEAENAIRFHNSLPCYKETALKSLSFAAEKYGVGAILVKDESTRFGLNAFKGLGGSYAIFRILCGHFEMDYRTSVYEDFLDSDIREQCEKMVFVTATDGNHGKGVAWAANLFGSKSHVLMPKGSAESRKQAIEEAGASSVLIMDLNYDKTVALSKKLAKENGWILVQDTSWEGYEETPRHIIEGYLTMAQEILGQMGGKKPTHVFLQAGVGAMAGGITGYLMDVLKDDPPIITVVEPDTVACVYMSAEIADGKPHSVEGDPETIMAGLNCGTPCSIAWPVLRDAASLYCACDDSITIRGMRAYAFPENGDPAVVSGESGAVTYGLLLEILEDSELRKLWKIDENSNILLINTEGATDPVNYKKILSMEDV